MPDDVPSDVTSSTVPSAALVVAVLATIALGTRPAPRRPPVEPSEHRGRHAPSADISPSAPLDVNRATAEEFEALPRVGPALAARLVAFRDANGPYRSLEDLDRVTGVGPSLLAKLAPVVRFGSADQNRSISQPTRNASPIESRPGTTSVRNP